MKFFKAARIAILIVVIALISASVTTGCSGSSSGMTRSKASYGARYRGYHRRHWGYPPAYIGGVVVDPDWGGGYPDAVQLPAVGMPDMGGMDMGGFDW